MSERLNVNPAPASVKLVEPQAQFERINRAHEKWIKRSADAPEANHVRVVESCQDFLVHAAVLGFEADDLQVSLEPRRVTIASKRRTAGEGPNGRRSRSNKPRVSELLRIIDLPVDVDTVGATAILRDGILELSMPKSGARKAARLEVRTA